MDGVTTSARPGARRRARLALAAVAMGTAGALAGCSADGGSTPAPPAPPSSSVPSAAPADPSPRSSSSTSAATPALLLEDGLGLVDPLSGSVSRAVLGGPVDAPLAVGLAAFGTPPELDPTACTLDQRDSWVWPQGLVVHARDGLFLGWTLRPGSPAADVLTTASGIGIGSTGTALQAVYDVTVESTSLGEEFAVGQLSGVLDAAGETGRVIALWGGDGCVAR